MVNLQKVLTKILATINSYKSKWDNCYSWYNTDSNKWIYSTGLWRHIRSSHEASRFLKARQFRRRFILHLREFNWEILHRKTA